MTVKFRIEREILFWFVIWCVNLGSELYFSNLAYSVGFRSAHICHSLISPMIYFLGARIYVARTVMSTSSMWLLHSLKVGLFWFICSNLADLWFWKFMVDASFGYTLSLYMFWEGNLKILRAAAQLTAPYLMTARMIRILR